jgi:hypothetical protein
MVGMAATLMYYGHIRLLRRRRSCTAKSQFTAGGCDIMNGASHYIVLVRASWKSRFHAIAQPEQCQSKLGKKILQRICDALTRRSIFRSLNFANSETTPQADKTLRSMPELAAHANA